MRTLLTDNWHDACIADLAYREGLSYAKVRQFIKSGQLKAVNYALDPNGKRQRLRVTREAWNEFVKSREVHATTTPAPSKARKAKPTKEYVK